MRVVVVGGGAAGMMAAYASSKQGNDTILVERNEKLGKKIYITGKGRCNLTNNCDRDRLMKNVVRNPKFLYSAFNSWDSSDMISFIESEGCPVKTERGDRVFPVSDHASDVIKALQRALKEVRVEVMLNTRVIGLDIIGGRACGVKLENGQSIEADHVIMATGGASYATTGSDGSAFRITNECGHECAPLRPALVPLLSADEWTGELQGLSLKNVILTLLRGKKKIYEELGEMLFTDKGISGPLALSASSYFEPGDIVTIDLKPGLDKDKLDERILRDFKKYSNKVFINSLDDLLPRSLIPVIVNLSGIDPETRVHQVTSAERQRLVSLLKDFVINVTGTGGFNEAIITRGGIPVKQIDPSTMHSKCIEGLSFAGEMIDVDALTGGFNLQIAWSTGYLAGLKACE